MMLQSKSPNYADPALHTAGLYIGGEWQPGSGIAVHDPSTGKVLGEVADASAEDALRAVDAAHAAAAAWRERSEEHTSELQSRENLVCRLLLEKKKDRAR